MENENKFEYNVPAIRFTVEGFGIKYSVVAPQDFTAKEAVFYYPEDFHQVFVVCCGKLYHGFCSKLANEDFDATNES